MDETARSCGPGVECEHPNCQMINAFIANHMVQHGPGVYATEDPETAIMFIKLVSQGVDGMAMDIVAQAQALADRAAEVSETIDVVRSKDEELYRTIVAARSQGKSGIRKIGRRSFWQEVKRWFTRTSKTTK